MSTTAAKAEARSTIPVAKSDVIAVWSLLESMVVSLHRIGSHFSVPTPEDKLSEEDRRKMLDALDAYFTPERMRELAKARRLLGEYLPDDEAEAISEQLDFWQGDSSRHS
jgi:hypothetical protein